MSITAVKELRRIVDDCQGWWRHGDELIYRLHKEMIGMGTFANPLEDELKGLTLQEWQFVRAKRLTLAALDYIIPRLDDELDE